MRHCSRVGMDIPLKMAQLLRHKTYHNCSVVYWFHIILLTFIKICRHALTDYWHTLIRCTNDFQASTSRQFWRASTHPFGTKSAAWLWEGKGGLKCALVFIDVKRFSYFFYLNNFSNAIVAILVCKFFLYSINVTCVDTIQKSQLKPLRTLCLKHDMFQIPTRSNLKLTFSALWSPESVIL